MTKRHAACIAVLAAGILLAMVSCAKPPSDEARRARAALLELRDASKAEKWAPDEFAAASAALQAAEKERSRQDARFFTSRDYAKAAELYLRAIEDAGLARDAARAGKESAEKEARAALEAAGAAIDHALAAVTVAPVSRDSRTSFDLLDQQLDRASEHLEEARRLIVSEDYAQATRRAEEILEQVTSMLRNVRGRERR